MNFGLVLAAGQGVRFGASSPKQLVRLAGRPVFEHALEAIEQHEAIDGTVLVGSEGVLERGARLRQMFPKLLAIVPGGASRAESTWHGLRALATTAVAEDRILIHDGARPFVSQRILTDVLAALEQYDAVDTVIDSADTKVFVDGGRLSSIPARSRIKRGQTPQGFRYGKICAAFERYIADTRSYPVTDDCAIYLRFRQRGDSAIGVVDGSETNIKLTYPSDLTYAEEILRTQMARVPEAFGSLEGKSVVVFGGTSGIGRSLCQRLLADGAATYALSRSTGCDVTRPDEIRRALERIARESGGIDAVVLTAGVMVSKALVDHSAGEIDDEVNTNLVGAVHVAQRAFPYLRRSGGQLLFFSSSSYTRGREGYALYSATKAALVNLCQALADEWRPWGVRVNCLAPSRTDTPLRRGHFSAGDDSTDMLDPMTVAAQAEAVLRSNLSGQVIAVRSQLASGSLCAV